MLRKKRKKVKESSPKQRKVRFIENAYFRPDSIGFPGVFWGKKMVRAAGFEPATPSV
jgi:hypothetical protein